MKTILLSGAGKNALSTSLMQRTLAEVREAKHEPIFLTGDGDAFSAGLNLKEVSNLDVAGMTTFLETLEQLVEALYAHPAPVVAWVNGHAIAGGCVLALTADIRVMTGREGARIGLNEVALGLRFPPLTFAMVRARLTRPALERVLLEAALYEAGDARALGLVDLVGEESVARAMLSKLASHPADIYAATKLLLRPRLEVTDADRTRFREDTIPYWASPERRAALLSVLERRR
ncbi:MAG: enoyl-CoA hydratase/isomerase family protein [Labilithrix sp.]|nr:enoyl-CoA hydratase/isomerase family protein [Labilithrix sp.]